MIGAWCSPVGSIQLDSPIEEAKIVVLLSNVNEPRVLHSKTPLAVVSLAVDGVSRVVV